MGFIPQIPLVFTLLYAATFIFSVLVNAILLKFAQTLGVRNTTQREIRWNASIRPSLGGISFYLSFLLTFIFLAIFIQGSSSTLVNIKILGILFACSLGFLMGLADDAYNTQPMLKFMAQLVCALILIFTGTQIHLFENEFLNYGLTILWVIGLMNSVNMLDNMDAITTVVSCVVLCFVITLSISTKSLVNPLSILALGILGSLCGFLLFNWHPAKMFMGDTGSQFLGVFLAIVGIDCCWNMPSLNLPYLIPGLNILLVILVFIIPITDTTTVVINRMWRGQSPFVGGKDHTTHHLFFKGVTEKRVALLYLALQGGGAYLAYSLILSYSIKWVWYGIIYSVLVFFSLYLNTVIKKKK